MSEAVLRNYLRKIEKAYQAGNATEHTYRSARMTACLAKVGAKGKSEQFADMPPSS